MEAYLIKLGQISEMMLQYIQGLPPVFLLGHVIILIVMYHVLKISLVLLSMSFQKSRRRRNGNLMERTFFSKLGPCGKRVLIAGDSTAMGTGADKPEGTFTNMLARDFPKVDIFNVAANGAMTRDILKQFEKYKYILHNAIIISTGGNDLWSLITIKKLRKDLRSVLKLAKAMSSNHVFVIFFGNAGSAPLFPFFIRKFLLSRERRALKIFTDICADEGVQLIELFTDKNGNPFVENPKRYFSGDRLHPSSDGYALWYEHIFKFIQKKGDLV